MLVLVDHFCGPTHHNVILRSGDSGQYIDTVSREVSSLFGPVVDAVSPAGVHHMLSVVFVQDDQIPLAKTQECGICPSCEIKIIYRDKTLSSWFSSPKIHLQ